MKTKDRILDAALELFNEKGTTEISTHHIAAKCGISPGNLYYHFSNKEEIIRAIFHQALAFVSEQEKTLISTTEAAGSKIEMSLALLSSLNWRYRFLKRDLPLLLMNDQQLRELFHTIHQQQVDNLRRELNKSKSDGVIQHFSTTDINKLSKIFWLVALFWPTFLEVSGDAFSKENLDEGVDLIRLLIELITSDYGKQQLHLEKNK